MKKRKQRCWKKKRADEDKKKLLQSLKGKDNVTLDGKRVNIYANIGSVNNIGAVLVNDAGGIGLFRSEFLYLENNDFPSEEQQFNAYKRVLESMAGKKVIIRTLDIGADKQAEYFNLKKKRILRWDIVQSEFASLSLKYFAFSLGLFFRASVYGSLGIMFPMITSVSEVKKFLTFAKRLKRS